MIIILLKNNNISLFLNWKEQLNWILPKEEYFFVKTFFPYIFGYSLHLKKMINFPNQRIKNLLKLNENELCYRIYNNIKNTQI